MYGYIYLIKNLENDKIYIGQTTQKPNKRKNNHFWKLKNNTHNNPHLQNSFNKYGEDPFQFKVLNWAKSKNELDKQEIYFIQKYDALNPKKGYNLQTGGASGKHSKETRQKISENNCRYWEGKKRSEKTRQKISKLQKGKCLFGFTKAHYNSKKVNPWGRVWITRINYNYKRKSLGCFNDPLSAELVNTLVEKEIYS